MRVAIIGGGVLGLALAYCLSKRGVEVVVFEARERPGGLLDYFEVDGATIDRYYHCILSSDSDLLSLIDEVGLGDRLRFTETKQGFYSGGSLYPLASARDFLLFPPLTLTERFRLGMTILMAMRTKDWRDLEEVGVEDWLVGMGGRGVFEKLWKPLLRAKFDGNFASTPATYIWSRLVRTASTRAAAGQKERMAYLVGGSRVLVEGLIQGITGNGGEVRLGVPVRELVVESGRVSGVRTDHEESSFDGVVATVPVPVLSSLLPDAQQQTLGFPLDADYLGIVCGVVLLDRKLTRFYTLNIADESIPFTGLIETTNLIDPRDVAGFRLVYLPKYVLPGNPYWGYSDGDLRQLYMANLKKMFPAFDESWVRGLFVFRERFVEPLHLIGRRRPVLPVAYPQLPGLFVVNNGQIYPDLTNCQSSVRHAAAVLPSILEAIGGSSRGVGAARVLA